RKPFGSLAASPFAGLPDLSLFDMSTDARKPLCCSAKTARRIGSFALYNERWRALKARTAKRVATAQVN
ncbi:MAG TPA: hypothetical protein PJ982_18380, partial [Lacipirellulaceae bacterium]|nr:hypothetical protein [Lacipirellulaceae bacterium]